MALILRVVRLWPEVLLTALTVWLLSVDGLRSSAGDPSYYFTFAGKVAEGMLPYRDVPWEYPPVSLLPVLLPFFLSGAAPSLETYLRLLFAENVLFLVAIGAGILWLARRGWSSQSLPRTAIAYAALTLAMAPVVVWRYDALAVVLSVAAVVAVAVRRLGASGVALGTGVMTKLYPLAMLPALMVGQIRSGRIRPAIVLAIGSVAGAALAISPFVLITGGDAFSWLPYSTNRGVQIESVPGGLALLAGQLTGERPLIFHGFGTWQVDSPLIPILSSFWTVLTAALVALLGLAIWQRYRADRLTSDGLTPASQVTHLVAALVVVLVSSRILSPQYMFWVAPFVALTNRPKTLVFWVACLMSTFIYPLRYQDMLNQELYAVLIVNVRNAILVGFLVWLIGSDLRLAFVALAARVRGRSRPR